MTSRRRCIQLLLASFAMSIFGALSSHAAGTASGRVSVTIVGSAAAIRDATGIGIIVIPPLGQRTNQEAGIGMVGTRVDPQSASTPPAISATPTPLDGALAPGAFSVSGEAGHVFSLSMPEQVLLNVNGNLMLLREFSHSAGAAPVLQPDGSLRVNFEAHLESDPAAILPEIETAAGESGPAVILEIGSQESGGSTSPGRRVMVRRPDHFGSQRKAENDILIMISYN